MLIAFEGIAGAGKSTQVELLRQWLAETGVPSFVSPWNASELVAGALKDAKRARQLTPRGYSLLHAAAFADRYDRQILPLLRTSSDTVILCDRYTYTAFARDVARGLYSRWVHAIYSFARTPDLTFFLKLDPAAALRRIEQSRDLKYYEAGLDLKLASDPARSFLIFQARVAGEYARLAAAHAFTVVDAGRKRYLQHLEIREHVIAALARECAARHQMMPGLTTPAERVESIPIQTVDTE